jgi:hypothetical protein
MAPTPVAVAVAVPFFLTTAPDSIPTAIAKSRQNWKKLNTILNKTLWKGAKLFCSY